MGRIIEVELNDADLRVVGTLFEVTVPKPTGPPNRLRAAAAATLVGHAGLVPAAR